MYLRMQWREKSDRRLEAKQWVAKAGVANFPQIFAR
jgi:hypothetical protein